jgi:TolB protein
MAMGSQSTTIVWLGRSAAQGAARLTRSARLRALWIAALLAGCRGDGTGTSDFSPRAEMIVSDPTLQPATAGLRSTAPPMVLATEGSAYVSLPPGAVPDGNLATIRDRRNGATTTALMVAGGFDPVPILASPGDTLDIDIDQFSGGQVHIVMPVPIKRPPVIVRTDPPPKKRDVPLNSVVVVVFSEPIDSVALSSGAVGLFSGSTQVPAHVALRDSGLRVVLQPDALLAPSSTYTLIVTSDIHDLEGDALQTPLNITFTTAASASVRSQIAFTQLSGGGGSPAGIYTINPDGTGATLVVDDYGNFGTREPAWSPDGRRLAFISSRHQAYGFPGGAAVYVISADGSGLTRLTNSPAWDEWTAWSPDGAKIAFSQWTCMNPDCTQQGYRAIYTVNVDGSGLTRLTNPVGIGDDEGPSWSPDGTRLAFVRSTDSTGDVFVMNPDGSNLIRLTGGRYLRSPAWSPDGRLIAYARAPSSTGNPDFDIYIMNADGSQVRQLTSGPAADWSPSWSPDGTRIVFYSEGRDPGQSIFIVNVDGSGVTRVTDNPYGLTDPNWSHASSP